MRRPTLLWDVDGTLIEHAPAVRDRHAHAVDRALSRHSPVRPASGPRGLPGEPRGLPVATLGKTDRQIIIEILAGNGQRDAGGDSSLIDAALAHLDEVTIEDLAVAPASALPGVADALRLLGAAGARNLLLTGNTPRRAEVKVRTAGLADHFDLGSGFYGHHHATRMELVVQAAATLDPAALASTVIIGDTPLDITAARGGGVKVIAVATGAVSIDELAAHAPDALVAYIEPAEFIAAIDRLLS
ncbi:MAG: haloacid dehalogenase-like hydrolase [Actinomycetales bacterium]|nr:haloacid dehalogenase-like hydrolase [Actinomycetales bacterium]